jgi:hypothetical protein
MLGHPAQRLIGRFADEPRRVRGERGRDRLLGGGDRLQPSGGDPLHLVGKGGPHPASAHAADDVEDPERVLAGAQHRISCSTRAGGVFELGSNPWLSSQLCPYELAQHTNQPKAGTDGPATAAGTPHGPADNATRPCTDRRSTPTAALSMGLQPSASPPDATRSPATPGPAPFPRRAAYEP